MIPFALVSDDNKDRRHEVTFTDHDGQTEAARLAALLGYRILDPPPERAFDDLVVEQPPGAVYIEDLGASSGSYFSPQIDRLTGYSADEWASEADFFSRVLQPEDRRRVLEAFVTTESVEGEGTTFRVSLPKTPILADMPSKHAA